MENRYNNNERDYTETELPQALRFDEEQEELSLGEIIALLMDRKWLILAILVAALLLGGFYIWKGATIYRAEAILMVEDGNQNVLGISDMDGLFPRDSSVTAEIELLTSLRVSEEVVKELGLNLVVRPKYFPVLGEAYARGFSADEGEKFATPILGLSEYAWGGESIKVKEFEVPDECLGLAFTMVAAEPGRYRLLDHQERQVLEGRVGETAETELDCRGLLRVLVVKLEAREDTRFHLTSQSVLRSANVLRGRLEVSEKGDRSGVISLALEGSDTGKIRDIVNALVGAYVRKNVGRKTEELEKSIEFIESQLPLIEVEMEEAERVMNNYRNIQGSVDLSSETRLILDKVVGVETVIAQLQREKKVLQQSYTEKHPKILSLEAQLEELEIQLERLNMEIKELPDTQQDILRMERNTKVNTEMFTYLLNKAQELKVARAGTVANVQVIDYAYRPYIPIAPKKKRILMLSLLMGLFLGGGLAFLLAMTGGVDDPEQIERKLGIQVYATVPFSNREAYLSKLYDLSKKGRRSFLRMLRRSSPSEPPSRVPRKSSRGRLLALTQSDDIAVESLRSLRTSLHFMMQPAESPVLMITGPGLRVGKSFITANLGALLVKEGTRVLVIDADMRKGRLHTYYGRDRRPGLSDLLNGTCEKNEALQLGGVGNVDFLPAGTRSDSPSELLMRPRFKEFLRSAAAEYDMVIIDTPPSLMVTDASIVGRLAYLSLMVVKDRAHSMRELTESVKRLRHAGVDLQGVIFNQMNTSRSRYGYGRYYGYKYSYTHKYGGGAEEL